MGTETMRSAALIIAGILVGLAAFAYASQRVEPEGITPLWADGVTATCDTAGTTSFTAPAGRYLLQVANETVAIDDASGAAIGTDSTFIAGYAREHRSSSPQTLYCASAGGTGTIYIVRLE